MAYSTNTSVATVPRPLPWILSQNRRCACFGALQMKEASHIPHLSGQGSVPTGVPWQTLSVQGRYMWLKRWWQRKSDGSSSTSTRPRLDAMLRCLLFIVAQPYTSQKAQDKLPAACTGTTSARSLQDGNDAFVPYCTNCRYTRRSQFMLPTAFRLEWGNVCLFELLSWLLLFHVCSQRT